MSESAPSGNDSTQYGSIEHADESHANDSTSLSTAETTETTDPFEDSPWPYTFERSISLLAGPKADVADIARITRSPRVVPFQAAAAKKRLKKLGRGYSTPDPHGGPRMDGGDYSPEPNRFGPMKKTFSLDFPRPSLTFKTLASASDERERKQKEKMAKAAAYRQKILSQSTAPSKSKTVSDDHDEENVYHSPGYQREKESDKHTSGRLNEEKNAKLGTSTFVQCVFNMSNILMGVGMLTLPYVFKSAGWIGGLTITISFAAITWRTSILIGRELNGDSRPCHFFDDSPFKSPTIPASSVGARQRISISSFPDIARESFGHSGAIILASVLYFELFSTLSIFFVTLGDHLHTVMPDTSEKQFMIYSAFALTVPTALLRTPKLLSYLSVVGTFATIAVVLAVVLSGLLEGDISGQVADTKAFETGIIHTEPHHILWKTSGFPLAMGLIAYTFSGHAIVPSIYSSMERPQDFEKMIHASFLVVLSSCLLVAISGYYMFGSAVNDQITISLQQYSSNSVWSMTVLTWLMILTAFSKYTLSMFPLALGIEEIVAPCIHSEKTMETVSSVIRLVLIVLSLLVALFVPSFSVLCSLVGLICTFIVSVIFPAAAHLKLFRERIGLWEAVLDLFFIFGGTLAAVIGTVATLSQ